MGSRRVYITKIYTETAPARLLNKMGIDIRYTGIMCCAYINLLINCIIALPIYPIRPRTTFAFPPISDDIRRPELLRYLLILSGLVSTFIIIIVRSGR
jgi:hypothetical protein